MAQWEELANALHHVLLIGVKAVSSDLQVVCPLAIYIILLHMYWCPSSSTWVRPLLSVFILLILLMYNSGYYIAKTSDVLIVS